jgi:hypothetical protein
MNTFQALNAIAIAGVLIALPASATPKHHRHHQVSPAARHTYANQPQIACTVVGCQPVPRGCHPEIGYTPDGTPTGFDIMVCENQTLYGNRFF